MNKFSFSKKKGDAGVDETTNSLSTLDLDESRARADSMAALATDALTVKREAALHSFEGIDWDAYTRTGTFLSQQDVALLRSVESQPLEVVFADEVGAKTYIDLLLKLLENMTSNSKAVDYILTKMEEILATDTAKRSALFLPAGGGGAVEGAPFLRLLRGGGGGGGGEADPFRQRGAALVLATLLGERPGEAGPLLDWCAEALAGGRGRGAAMKVAVGALAVLLRRPERRGAWARRGGVGYLARLLRLQGSEASAQLLYEIAFALWALALGGAPDTRAAFLAEGAVPALVEQVAAAPREKVVRVALAALRLLAEGEDADHARGGGGAPQGAQGGVGGTKAAVEEMLHCGLAKTLRNLRQRQWADPDVGADVEVLHAKLMKDYHELSTFEMYAQEVRSGALRWGVCHTEKFWKENVRSMEADDFALVKALTTLLHSSDDEVVAIACYDIGEFVRFYPNGKSIIKHINAKGTVMDLIEHDNPTVQRHALQCISKIMVNKWEFVR